MEHNLDHTACDQLGAFFTIFAHPTRMRLFCALREGPRTVSQIAEYAGITLQNASQQLRLMRDRGAVVARKSEQHVFYSVSDPRFFQAAEIIHEALVDVLRRRAGDIPEDDGAGRPETSAAAP